MNTRTLGQQIIALRTERGLSQGLLARISRVPQSVLARIEQDEREPLFSTLHAIALALDVSLGVFDQVVGGE